MVDYNQLTNQIMSLLEQARFDRTCINCEHFSEQSEGCALASGQRPPAKIIVTGCHLHLPKIPF